jgi:hypothetical protein
VTDAAGKEAGWVAAERSAAIAAHARRWIDQSLSTEPADWARWEQGARRLYAVAGVAWPPALIRVRDPRVMREAWVAAQPDGELRTRLARWTMEGSPDALIARDDGRLDPVLALPGRLVRRIREVIGSAVPERYARSIRRTLQSRLDALVAVHASVAWPVPQLWLRHGRLAELTFYRDVCGMPLPADLRELAEAFELCLSSAWWSWMDADTALVCDRPERLCWEPSDATGVEGPRLHADRGPAIAWRDGFSLWYVHGVQVSRQIVDAPETLTPGQILGEPNVPLRRVMIDRFGADRLMMTANSEIVDQDQDRLGRPRLLRRQRIPGDEDIVMVQVANATPDPEGWNRLHLLRVPPTVRSCAEAVAWTFGMEASEYAPVQET